MLPYKITISNLSPYLLCFLLLFTACKKEDKNTPVEIIDPTLKKMVIATGLTNNEININSSQWSIAYIKDAKTNENLLKNNTKKTTLDHDKSLSTAAKWLQVEKTAKNTLNISIAENLTETPRIIVIGIEANKSIEEIHIVQRKGAVYQVVAKKIKEIEGSRKMYNSMEGCKSITFSNSTNIAKNVEISSIFEDVKATSTFTSTDMNAFDWTSQNNAKFFMKEILVNGAVVWDKEVEYKKGDTFTPFLNGKNKQELLIQPFTNITVRGEMGYLERSSHYTLTVKNINSGHLFEVNGIWTQKIPLTPHTIIVK